MEMDSTGVSNLIPLYLDFICPWGDQGGHGLAIKADWGDGVRVGQGWGGTGRCLYVSRKVPQNNSGPITGWIRATGCVFDMSGIEKQHFT